MAKKINTETLLSEFTVAKSNLEQSLKEYEYAQEAYNKSLITLHELKIAYDRALRDYINNSHEPYSSRESEVRSSYANQFVAYYSLLSRKSHIFP